MTTTITPVELIDDEQKQLVAVAQQNGLQPETAQSLQVSFAPLFAQAKNVIEKSKLITVTDASQKLEIKTAELYRKELKNIRIAGDKIRKQEKEESWKKGKAIDGFYAILDHLVSAEEKRLTEQEKFVELKEASRKAALKIEREELLKPFAIDLTGYALGEMSAETFDQLLTGTKLTHEAKIEAARKAEADRIAKEAADQAERARIQAENERLKKEAEAAKIEADRIEKARIAAEQEAARVLAEEKKKAEESARIERDRVLKEQADTAAAAKAELDRREAMAAEERRKAEVAAAEIRRIAAENAAKAAEEAKKEREAIEAKAATERAELKRKADEEAKAAAEAARKEREAIEAKAKIEREAAEADAAAERLKRQLEQVKMEQEMKAEREARAKIEAEQAAAKQAEHDRIAAERFAAQKAAAAPDREKLLAFAAAIKAVRVPELSTEAGLSLIATIEVSHEKFVAWINEKAGAL